MKILFVISQLKGPIEFSPFIIKQAESLRQLGLTVDHFILKGYSFIKYIKGIIELKKYLKNHQYDIIHAHCNYNGWTCSFLKIPFLVVSFLGSDLLAKENYFSSIINRIVNKRVLKKADLFICKTEEMRRMIPIKKPVAVIPNGIDFNFFYPINKVKARNILNLNISKKYILFTANPKRKEKNYRLAENAIKILNDSNIEMLVIFNHTQEDLNLYYNASDLLLLTSLHEGGVNVVKEAMACNCPVVSTNVGDVNEVISNTENCHVTSFDPYEIAQKIRLTLDSGIRTTGRKDIEKYNTINIANRIINIYNEVRLKLKPN